MRRGETSEAAPPEPLALLDDDYEKSVLRLAWDFDKKSGTRTLLFAFVELLPKELPAPIDDYNPKSERCHRRLAAKSDHRVYVRHAVVTAREGLDWYLACMGGKAVVPPNPGEQDRNEKTANLEPLGQEPAWPALNLIPPSSDVVPFVPAWAACPRVHHLLPTTAMDVSPLWNGAEKAKAMEWLQRELGVDLSLYPEYWGSVHLVAPNPVYRRMRVRVVPEGGGTESVVVQLEPRAGRTVRGLRVSLREQAAWGVTSSQQITVEQPLVKFRFPHEVGSVLEEVWDEQRGLLYLGDTAHPFARTINLGFAPISRELLVVTGEETFRVARTGSPEVVTVGDPARPPSARQRLVVAQEARRKRRRAKEYDQVWFNDQKAEARAVVRALVHGAQEEVLIVDPYFAAKDLIAFPTAVGRQDVPIRILTSAEKLKETVAPESSDEYREAGDALLDALDSLKATESMNSFEIRVMTGSRPDIHDRFLAIDREIWQVGSSLSEFGSRGTIMLRLPDPDAVRPQLEIGWEKAESLRPWLQARNARREAAMPTWLERRLISLCSCALRRLRGRRE